MEPASSNTSAKIISALIIGLIVGFLAGAFWQERRTAGGYTGSEVRAVQSEDTNQSAKALTGAHVSGEKSGAVTTTAVMGNAGLAVADQSAGSSVSITNIDAKETLWVAVREEKEGKLGNILGAQKVQEGSGQTVTVELLRPTVAGGTYHIVLYRDVGDPAFNYREDVAVEGAKGTFVAK